MTNPPATSASRRLSYLRLMRLPNVFTAMADIAMGFWVTHESFQPAGVFALLLLSSSCLYIAGMILNDVYDIDIDRQERPSRPLPSGQIDLGFASHLGHMLLTIGMLIGFFVRSFVTGGWWIGMVAFPLAGLIIAYNRYLKHTPLGPLAMGGCRFLNVLLGMSAATEAWSAHNWTIAAGLGIYITGITWFARSEASVSNRPQLTAALLVMLAGISILGWYPQITPPEKLLPAIEAHPQIWALLWLAIALVIGGRAARAIFQPDPAHVQAAVKTGILSIIVLDAAIVLAIHGPIAAVAILCLLAPTILLGHWVYST